LTATRPSYFWKSIIIITYSLFFASGSYAYAFFQQVPADTVNSDTTDIPEEYEPSVFPTYDLKDRYGNPYLYHQSPSPLYLQEPPIIQQETEVDTSLNYTIYENIGDLNYRPATRMTFDQYRRYRSEEMRKEYWQERSAGLDGESSVSGRRLIPPIYMSPVLDRIFGGSFVDIRPNGFVTLDFGGRWQRVQNPAIPIRQQRTGGFEFDQQISLNVTGKIGEKLAIIANFDNNNTFDFQNDLKVEYTGFEEDIIQKLEIGNVSMPVSNSLISGAQKLFGVKGQFRFGDMWVTAVASTQRGKNESIVVNSGLDGGQGRDFSVQASSYDENRHFFLGHFFRDNYEKWLSRLPQINSSVQLTRVEVYVMNRQNNTQNIRNFAAFMDLGEGRVIYRDNNAFITPGQGNAPNDNDANAMYNSLQANPNLRNQDEITNILEQDWDLVKSTDFEIITSARKLDEREYTFNKELGIISLTRKLQNDEVLAVSYEYRYLGQTYKVGEMTEDYQNLSENDVVFLKMLRPTKINPEVPTWDLMMKNIYSLNASQISQEGFRLRVVYRDDRAGVDNPSINEGARTNGVPLIELTGLDRLNVNNDPQKDGNFDFVPNITIIPETGLVMFPVLEPFGSNLRQYFNPDSEADLIRRYVYDDLYEKTRADAELVTTLNKYFLVGKMQAGSSSEIVLPGINIAEGSVIVKAGSAILVENQDYRVDYNLGRVTILNESILNSGKRIEVSYEKEDLFNFQARSLLGTHIDYRVSEDINFGATLLYLNERPLISRVSIGDEPIRNLKYGFNMNYSKDWRFLTKAVDALPVIQTKAPSNVTFNAEFAQLVPGTSNKVDGEGTSYIDDFETSSTPISLGNNFQVWNLASTPATDDNRYSVVQPATNDLRVGFRRAKLAWYVVDNLFYGTSAAIGKPDNITDEDLDNHYVRQVPLNEVFKQRDPEVGANRLTVFDLAYFPHERGPYNFNPDLVERNNRAELAEPQRNWAGITRAVTTDVDFDRNNIEYIEFWLMDPFIDGPNGRVLDGVYNQNNTTGGKLVFNLGSISEDVMKDGRHAFENGLPAEGGTESTIENEWGIVTTQQFLTNAFDNSPDSRSNQDVGFDGLPSTEEATYGPYDSIFTQNLNLSPAVREQVLQDAAADDFQYYLGGDLDAANAKILERYKSFNSPENNSPVASASSNFTPSSTNLPNNEDLNNDNTLTDLEEYYEYEIDLRRNSLNLDNPYIVDQITDKGTGEEVNWYLFRVPIRKPTRKQGNINGFKSIRFIRTYLTDWVQPVVLRMVKFQMVGSQWRRYEESLWENGLYEEQENYDPNFVIDVVNIEENGSASIDENNVQKIPYVIPPGINRDIDNSSPVFRRTNEQSIQLCLEDLKDRDARAVYKNFNADLVNYGKIKMFVHAQENGMPLEDGDVSAFIRLGSDLEENFYEVEVPLKVTRPGASSPREIWPAENEINIDLNALYAVKKKRDNLNFDKSVLFTDSVGRYKVSVFGAPKLSTLQSIFLGVRNPGTPDEMPKSACVWFNELRVTDFDQTKGWAANAYLSMNLADLGNITASTRYTSVGFGGIQQKISQRTREETFEYDVSTSLNMEKFIPGNHGLKIPLFASYEERKITPFFDPTDDDIPLEAALEAINDPEEREEFKKIVQDKTVRRSINLVNVRKTKVKEDAKPHIYDIENLSVTYAYSDVTSSNYQIASFEERNYRSSIAYNFSPPTNYLEPFKNSKALDAKYLQLLKDFNLSFAPSNLLVRWDLDRKFSRTQMRNGDLSTVGIQPMWLKYFYFNRTYGLKWNLSKGLSIDYNARANAVVDEPEGDIITTRQRDEIIENLLSLGRMRDFSQDIRVNYRVPLDKIPLVNWMSADARYSTGYLWKAGSYSPIDSLNQQLVLGNQIQNNREYGVTGKIDFVRLYNKSKYLKSINSPSRRRSRSRTRPDAAAADTTDVKFGETKAAKGFMRFLMMVRNINVTYNIREATRLPGYSQQLFLLGMDSTWSAPGWNFILGAQDPSIRQRAASEGWLVTDTLLNTPFSQLRTYDLQIRSTIEPLNDLRIQVDLKKSATGNYEEIFRVDPDSPESATGTYSVQGVSRSGSYNISFSMLQTAFEASDNTRNSGTFNKFVENRQIIKDRLGSEYAINSQDITIPAFIAAYSGKDANTIDLTPFPRMPIPNWRLDYSGLGKIAGFKEVFSSFNITHGYRSSYGVNNYTNSQEYQENIGFENGLTFIPPPTIANDNGELIPVFLFGQVTLQEEFSPLIGINFRTKKQLTARLDYKIQRNLALNINNAQITEVRNRDVSLEVGYTKSKLRLPFKSQGRVITLDNDVTFKLNLTIQENQTFQRRIDEEDQVTNGNMNWRLRPQVNYTLSDRLNLNIYFERQVNSPKVSNQFPRSTTSAGFQLRFSLAQ
jgi:cell surface protein SprA